MLIVNNILLKSVHLATGLQWNLLPGGYNDADSFWHVNASPGVSGLIMLLAIWHVKEAGGSGYRITMRRRHSYGVTQTLRSGD